MVKPFNPEQELYDLGTFTGRLSYFLHTLSPRNLAYGNSTLEQYQKNIDEFVATKTSKISDEELWDQSYILKSNLHPETKKPIQLPFRFSSTSLNK